MENASKCIRSCSSITTGMFKTHLKKNTCIIWINSVYIFLKTEKCDEYLQRASLRLLLNMIYTFVIIGPSTSPQEKTEESAPPQQSLSDQLGLEELWNTLGDCLTELAKTPDHHAVLILQPAVEAFFIVHAGVYATCTWNSIKTAGQILSLIKLFIYIENS